MKHKVHKSPREDLINYINANKKRGDRQIIIKKFNLSQSIITRTLNGEIFSGEESDKVIKGYLEVINSRIAKYRKLKEKHIQ